MTALPSCEASTSDAARVDWAELALPDAWPDQARFQRVTNPWRVMLSIRRKRAGAVVLPEGMPGASTLPRYLLQEFHNLPNGNYSKSITQGYSRAFDFLMLGTLRKARDEVAAQLRGVRRALDIGAGAGQLSARLLRAGIPEVVALEPSPYLLQKAAKANPALTCVQGVVEANDLPSAHFDGAGACFVFHEIPPSHADAALEELRRVLIPGSKLVLVEPSPEQWTNTRGSVWRSHGWRGVYFHTLARRVHEPFADAWHRRDARAWLETGGFNLEQSIDAMPWKMLIARRQG